MYLSRIQLTEALLEQTQLTAMLRRDNYGMHQLLWDLFETGNQFLYREENSHDQLGTPSKKPLFYVLSDQPPKTDSPLFKVDCREFNPRLSVNDRLSFQLRANPTVARKLEGKQRSSRHDVIMDAKYQHLLNICVEQGVMTESDIYLSNCHGRRELKQGLNRKQLQQRLFELEGFRNADSRQIFFQQQSVAVEQAAKNWMIKKGAARGFELETVQATGYLWRSLASVKQKRNAGYSSMDYQGIIRVTEPHAFLEQLHKGFGPAKRFGCGLMLIRRA